MALPPIFIQFLGDWTGLAESADGVEERLAEVDAEGSMSMEGLGAVSTGVLLGIGAAAVGAAYEGVKLATSFQSAMTRISTQAGVPRAALSVLSNDVLNLAGQVGFSPDSLAEALYHIESSFASVGVTGPQAMNMLKIAADGAAVGNSDLTDTTNALDAVIASGIKGAQDYSQAMGNINAAVGAGDMTMQDYADALSNGLLATMKGYGLTLTDVNAALDVFGDNNIRGANAATQTRMAVQALQTPVATAGDTLAALGLTTDTLGNTMEKGGLLPALEQLNTSMNKAGMNGDKMSQTLVSLYGKKAGTGIDILIGQLTRLQSKYPDLEAGANNFDSAVQGNNATLQQHVKDTEAALESLGIRIGNALLPPLTAFMGELSKGLSYLASHMDVFKAMAAGLGAITIALIVAKIATIEWTATLLLNPIVLIAAAIIALGVGVYMAYTHFKSFRDAISDVWHAMQTAATWFDQVIVHSKTLGSIMSAVGKDIRTAWNATWKEVGAAITWFENGPLKEIEAGINKLKEFWRQNGAEIEQDTEAVWKLIGAVLDFWMKYVVTTAKLGMSLLMDGLRVALSLIKSSWKLTWDMIADAFKMFVDFVVNAAELFLDVLHGKWSKAGTDAHRLFTDMFTDIKHMFGQFTSDAIHLLADAGENVVKGLVNGIKAGFGALKSVIGEAGGLIKSAFHSVMGIFSPSRVMYTSGTMVTKGVENALVDGYPQLKSAAQRMGVAITSGFSAAPSLKLGSLTTQAPSLGTSAGAGASVVQNVVQLSVAGHVLTDTDLRDLIQQELLKLDGRNSGQYLSSKV